MRQARLSFSCEVLLGLVQDNPDLEHRAYRVVENAVPDDAVVTGIGFGGPADAPYRVDLYFSTSDVRVPDVEHPGDYMQWPHPVLRLKEREGGSR